jgi:hypothetical protein
MARSTTRIGLVGDDVLIGVDALLTRFIAGLGQHGGPDIEGD